MSGIKIIDVKKVDLCSKCRKIRDKIPRWKDGTIVEDKDIACIGCAIGKEHKIDLEDGEK